ncbi:hypothetical protein LTR36_003863 [Oleoguttula mirabilis]|uniref:Uncharacterized protein n=1 Tax=Oleoguttula mirabilis TaxID=1507867 RepID=A0AAV9JJ44_9PEZI|nr:hypothetical protein LTR36_003863 [Oleoguttula mirabilis]
MSLIKRLSDSFWSYVSPSKPSATKPTPQTLPKFKKPAIPNRRASLEEVIRYSRSMSPIARVDSWRFGSSSEATSSMVGGGKRKQLHTPSTDAGRRKKARMMEDEEMDYVSQTGYDDDVQMGEEDVQMNEEDEIVQGGEDRDAVEEGDEYEESDEGEEGDEYEEGDEDEDEELDELASDISNVRVRSSSPASSRRSDDDDDDVEQDTTLVVSEEEYNRDSPPRRRRIIHIPEEHSSRGVSTEDLRAAGWCDNHIELVQHIAMRGFEPLLPHYYTMDYRYLPDALFSIDNEAVISSVCSQHYRGIVALQKLLEIGGRVRDRVLLNGMVTPEQQVKRSLREYIKWANTDASLDQRTAIPVLAIEIQPANTPAPELQERARRKMARLHARFEEAFRVRSSIETTPSTASTALSYPIPQLYAIIASHTFIALMAYRPELANEGQVKLVSHFNMDDKGYDVWNALALAIIVCHARNMQLRIAEETGLGRRELGGEPEVVDDPDL